MVQVAAAMRRGCVQPKPGKDKEQLQETQDIKILLHLVYVGCLYLELSPALHSCVEVFARDMDPQGIEVPREGHKQEARKGRNSKIRICRGDSDSVVMLPLF